MPTPQNPELQARPVIYLVYCWEDKRVKDDVVNLLRRQDPTANFDFRDYENDRNGVGLQDKFTQWANEAWYVLFICSNRWSKLEGDMLTELGVVERRANEIRRRHGDDKPFISILSIGKLRGQVQDYLKRFNVTWFPYSLPGEATVTINSLIEKFRDPPPWRTARGSIAQAGVKKSSPVTVSLSVPTSKLNEFFSQAVKDIRLEVPRLVPKDLTVGQALGLFRNPPPITNQLFLTEGDDNAVVALLTRGRVQDYLPPNANMIRDALKQAEKKQRLSNEALDALNEMHATRCASRALDIAFPLGAFPVLSPEFELSNALRGFLTRGGYNRKRVRALAVMSRTTAHGVLGYWNLVYALLVNDLIPDLSVDENLAPSEELYVASEEDTIAKLGEEMATRDVAQLPVVKAGTNNVFLGTILRETVRNLIDDRVERFSHLPVGLFLETPMPTLRVGDRLRDAAQYFREDTGYPMVAVLDSDGGGRLVGTITYIDILRAVQALLPKPRT